MSIRILQLAQYAEKKGFPLKALKRLILRHMNLMDMRRANWVSKENCDEKLPPVSEYPSNYPYVFGIIKEFWGMHSRYIAACRDLGVAYRLLDLSGSEWHETIAKSGCHAYLVYPSVQFDSWKQMYDERLRFVSQDMGSIIFPSYDELWLWDSKRRVYYWLQSNDVPCPETWIFYNRDEALEFASRARLPIVYKSNRGAGSSGVIIFLKRGSLLKHVDRCFKKGFSTYQMGSNDREWGSVLLQEYVPDAREWRVIRIGHSYFAYEKLKVGDFHSGSHAWRYSKPSSQLLDFAKAITDKGNFLSMDLDIFLTQDGRYLVNEVQTLFGMGHPYEMCVVDGKPGRMFFDPGDNSWQFEEGSFCQHYLCNLRVMALLAIMDHRSA